MRVTPHFPIPLAYRVLLYFKAAVLQNILKNHQLHFFSKDLFKYIIIYMHISCQKQKKPTYFAKRNDVLPTICQLNKGVSNIDFSTEHNLASIYRYFLYFFLLFLFFEHLQASCFKSANCVRPYFGLSYCQLFNNKTTFFGVSVHINQKKSIYIYSLYAWTIRDSQFDQKFNTEDLIVFTQYSLLVYAQQDQV